MEQIQTIQILIQVIVLIVQLISLIFIWISFLRILFIDHDEKTSRFSINLLLIWLILDIISISIYLFI